MKNETNEINPLRIYFNIYPNQTLREYEIDRPINCESYTELRRGVSLIGANDYTRKQWDKLPQESRPLAENLLRIIGVTEIKLSPYSVRVEISRALKWSEIQPQVFKVLGEWAGAPVEIVNDSRGIAGLCKLANTKGDS